MKGSQPAGLVLVLDLSASLYLAILDPATGVVASRIREQVVKGAKADKGAKPDQPARGETGHVLLEECLIDSGAKLGDIASICVGTGPGSFTGIRVGVSMAQGLGFTRQLPIYPYSSLMALSVCASNIDPAGSGLQINAAAAIAANAGRYFVRTESMGEALLSKEDLASLGAGAATLITSGQIPDREQFSKVFKNVERMEEQVDFLRILTLARSRDPVLDGIIRPNYLQASAAEEKRNTLGTMGTAGA